MVFKIFCSDIHHFPVISNSDTCVYHVCFRLLIDRRGFLFRLSPVYQKFESGNLYSQVHLFILNPENPYFNLQPRKYRSGIRYPYVLSA